MNRISALILMMLVGCEGAVSDSFVKEADPSKEATTTEELSEIPAEVASVTFEVPDASIDEDVDGGVEEEEVAVPEPEATSQGVVAPASDGQDGVPSAWAGAPEPEFVTDDSSSEVAESRQPLVASYYASAVISPQVWGATGNLVNLLPGGTGVLSFPVNPHWDRYEAVMASRVRASLHAHLNLRKSRLTAAQVTLFTTLINAVDSPGFYHLIAPHDPTTANADEWHKMVNTQAVFKSAEQLYTNEIDRAYSVRMRTTLHAALILTMLDAPVADLLKEFIKLHVTAFAQNGGWFTNFNITFAGAAQVVKASMDADMYKHAWTLFVAGLSSRLLTRAAAFMVANGTVGLRLPPMSGQPSFTRVGTWTASNTATLATVVVKTADGLTRCTTPINPLSRASVLSCTFPDGIARRYLSTWDGSEYLTTTPRSLRTSNNLCAGGGWGDVCRRFIDFSISPATTNRTSVADLYSVAIHRRSDIYLNDGWASHCWYDSYLYGTLTSGAPTAVGATRSLPLRFIRHANSTDGVTFALTTPAFQHRPRVAGRTICGNLSDYQLHCSTFSGPMKLPQIAFPICVTMP